MKIRLATILIVAIVCIAAWLFWSRARHVDMAAYVPADSLVFFEVDDLPEVAQGIVGTDAWRLLSGPAGASINLSISQWLVPVARWTGLGSTETVLLARSQFGVSLIRLETSEDNNNLNASCFLFHLPSSMTLCCCKLRFLSRIFVILKFEKRNLES